MDSSIIKCMTPMQDVNNRENWWGVGEVRIYGNFILSAEFICKPKTFFKNVLIKKCMTVKGALVRCQKEMKDM